MTEPQQKELDELYEQLSQEEECCEGCRSKNSFADECEGCGTHGNIMDLEEMIANISGEDKES